MKLKPLQYPTNARSYDQQHQRRTVNQHQCSSFLHIEYLNNLESKKKSIEIEIISNENIPFKRTCKVN